MKYFLTFFLIALITSLFRRYPKHRVAISRSVGLILVPFFLFVGIQAFGAYINTRNVIYEHLTIAEAIKKTENKKQAFVVLTDAQVDCNGLGSDRKLGQIKAKTGIAPFIVGDFSDNCSEIGSDPLSGEFSKISKGRFDYFKRSKEFYFPTNITADNVWILCEVCSPKGALGNMLMISLLVAVCMFLIFPSIVLDLKNKLNIFKKP